MSSRLVPKLVEMLLLALLFCARAEADTATSMVDANALGTESVSLTKYFDVLEDPDHRLTLTDVMGAEMSGKFKESGQNGEALSFGYTKSAYWLRIRIKNSLNIPVNRLLELAYARFTLIDFHQLLPDGSYQTIASGIFLPFSTRPYPNRNFVYPIALPAQSEQTFYIRMQSSGSLIIPARLWDYEAFHAYELKDYLIQAWYFGMVTGLLLFNLLLFVALRDAMYLLYVSFTGSFAFAIAAHHGLVKEFLWQNAPLWSNISANVGYSLANATILMLMRHMLNTAVVVPRIDRVIKLIIGILFLMILGYPWFLDQLGKPAALIYLGVGPFVIYTSICCARKGQRSAYFFIAAFVLILIGGTLGALRVLGLVPHNFLTVYGSQIGSAMEMLLLALALADRFNEIRKDKSRAQREALAAQKKLVEGLQASERFLEARVASRTEALHEAYRVANTAREEATLALDNLKSTQTQLIQSEKMAALGQLIAGIAHEINTPIGAVKSSGKNISDSLRLAIDSLAKLFLTLDAKSLELFMQLIRNAYETANLLSTREERAIIRELTGKLEAVGIEYAQHTAGILLQFRADKNLELYLPLLQHRESALILSAANEVGTIISNSTNINVAVDRISKIIFALKNFSRSDQSATWATANLLGGIETVLTLYQRQLNQGIELICVFEPTPPIRCLEDELIQVWTNLIHNALQAMNYKGSLSIGIKQIGNDAVISVGDTGCGIPEEIRARIFDPFFTTKPAGEGTGIGLDVVKRIIDKHHGRIEVQSAVGVGTTFLVYLPYTDQP